MAKKNILITGTGGFVGRSLAEHLGAKPDEYAVFAARHADLDLLDAEAVRSYLSGNRINMVLHCANVGGTRKTGYDAGSTDVLAMNLRMFFNLVRAMPDSARMINMGSGAEYGVRGVHRVKEADFDSRVPADAYGFAKYTMSKYIEKAGNMVSLRIFGLYGRYEDYRFKFISNAIVKNLLRMPIAISQNVLFDYLYIDDFLRLVELFIGHEPAVRHYNVTPAESIDLVSLAALINGAADRPSEVKVLNPGMNHEYTGDNARFLSEFRDFAFTPYAEGVRCLYAYYKANLDKLDLSQVREDPYLKNCRTR